MSGGSFEISGGFLPGAAPASCPGDLDGDRDVDLADLTQLLAHFGTTGAHPEDGESDSNGDVDLSDLTLLLANFGTNCVNRQRGSDYYRTSREYPLGGPRTAPPVNPESVARGRLDSI